MELNPQFISNYKDNTSLRISFNELAIQSFEIDFEQWYQGGQWNERYICYSYYIDNTIISNASANEMDLFIKGQPIKAVQIGTVMTNQSYQKQGLASDLINRIIDDYKNRVDFFYLFANQNVAPFYHRFGFSEIAESLFSHEIPNPPKVQSDIQKLNMKNPDDRKIANTLIKKRIPISSHLGISHCEHIVSWYTYNELDKCFYYLQNKDIIIVYEIIDTILYLYDIISPKPFNFHDIMENIVSQKVTKIHFQFTPDLLGIDYDINKPKSHDKFMVKSEKDIIHSPFKYPATARA